MSENNVTGEKQERNVRLNTANSALSGQPVKVSELIGTVVTPEDAAGISIVDIGQDSAFLHSVRNVRTYVGSPAAEATWGAIAQGDYIYFDASPTMPALVYLSTSPLADDGTANKIFGKALTVSATATAATVLIEVSQTQV